MGYTVHMCIGLLKIEHDVDYLSKLSRVRIYGTIFLGDIFEDNNLG